jgi:hypothetical protein
MAAHSAFPPEGKEPVVRGDPAAMVVRFQDQGVDRDITGWTFRSTVRDRLDGNFLHTCDTFEVHAANELPGFFPDAPGTTPAVLVARWSPAQTALWRSGFVADIEQLTPTTRTWVIFDRFRIDADVSYGTGAP